MLDGEELNEYFTSPLASDTDGDTLYQDPSFEHQLTDYNEIFAYDVTNGTIKPSDLTSVDGDNDTMPDNVLVGFNPMKNRMVYRIQIMIALI